MSRIARLAAVLALALAIGPAGCMPPPKVQTKDAPPADPARRAYLRTDRAPAGLAYSNAQLTEAFRQIMFYDEAVLSEGRFVAGRARKRLHKFVEPVRYAVTGEAATAIDRAHVADFVARLRRVTGLEIAETDDDPTIRVLFLTRAERQALGAEYAASEVWAPLAHDLLNDLPGSVCATYASPPSGPRGEREYLVVIPDEIRGLVRRSCIEEEIAQAFGPQADFAGARPSIFNDDEEFALLTAHDELLFRILYDPRLKPGMAEAEAMPIVEEIVAELRPSDRRKAGPADRVKPVPARK